jgi:hypothetical protein
MVADLEAKIYQKAKLVGCRERENKKSIDDY